MPAEAGAMNDKARVNVFDLSFINPDFSDSFSQKMLTLLLAVKIAYPLELKSAVGLCCNHYGFERARRN